MIEVYLMPAVAETDALLGMALVAASALCLALAAGLWLVSRRWPSSREELL